MRALAEGDVASAEIAEGAEGLGDLGVAGEDLGGLLGGEGEDVGDGHALVANAEGAGLEAGAKNVVCDGLDTPAVPQTPDFIKSLDVDHALDGEVLLAFEMNGAPLPMLNGFPLRLVVPGYFGTYWIKHLHQITVADEAFTGFFMSASYRIPDTPSGCIEPGTTPKSTVPITRFKIRSFITSVVDGAQVPANRETTLRGIAFDSGQGITEVLVSTDGGQSWRSAQLGKDLGKYSFREWSFPWTPAKAGAVELKCRALNRIGETQPLEPLWNPAGYLRNLVETVKVTVA